MDKKQKESVEYVQRKIEAELSRSRLELKQDAYGKDYRAYVLLGEGSECRRRIQARYDE